MKRLLLLAALFAATMSGARAYEFSAVAPTGQTLYYNIVSGGVQVTSQNTSYPYYSTYPTGALTIPDSVTRQGTTYAVVSIGEKAFYICSGLTSVTIPDGVASIGNHAFHYCIGLASVTIPNSVTTIGDDAFYHVRHIEYYGNATGSPWGAISMNGVTEGDFVYSDATKQVLLAYSGAGGSVVIPSTVETIGTKAFYGCTGLTSVTIPNSVTSIGESAFRYCSGLTSVTIGNSVTTIGNYAFQYCSVLTSFTIGSGVTSIGVSALGDCTGLRNIISKAVYPPTASDNTFENVPPYCTLTVPCGSQVTPLWNTQFPLMEEDCNPDGIDDAEVDGIRVWTENGQIKVEGADGLILHVFDMEGRQIANNNIPSGVYLVKIGSYPARKVVVIR